MGEAVPFAYYKKLPARARRIYDRSNEVGNVRLPAAERLRPQVDSLAQALRSSQRRATEAAAQGLADAMLGSLRIPGVEVRVLAKRPSRSWGELHGLYEPQEKGKPRITVWMRTAQRKQVVAFKTFLRTLLHEIGHHLDYELLELEDSLHTEGFYKRESSLFRQLVPDTGRYEERHDASRQEAAAAGLGGESTSRRGSRPQQGEANPKRRKPPPHAVVHQPELPFGEASKSVASGRRRRIRPSGRGPAFRSPPQRGRDG
jgi:hypothetical protein